jgi:hypothetical protein
MQTFGIFETEIGHVYLSKHYIYIQKENEIIDTKHLEIMLKKKSKNVTGTIFLFNPTLAPIGYNVDIPLIEQDFKDFNKFVELEFDRNCILLRLLLKMVIEENY